MNINRSSKTLYLICLLSCQFLANAHQLAAPSPSWIVYFSPRGRATSAIVQRLDIAGSTVLVQAYSFTSTPIAEALVRAHKRGVRVQVVFDKNQRSQTYSSADFLANASIPTLIDAAHAIANNKVMIIDNETVITGSFNFTKAAEQRNAENLLIIRDKRLASLHASNWNLHLSFVSHSSGTGRSKSITAKCLHKKSEHQTSGLGVYTTPP